MHHAFKLGEAEHGVEMSRSAHGYRLHLNGRIIPFSFSGNGSGPALIRIGGRIHDLEIATRGDEVFIHLDGETYVLRYRHPLDRLAAQGLGGADDGITAPMPGSIVSVAVKVGEAVSKGQTLLVMESMKMETTLVAPRGGVVAAIRFEKGQIFERDALLLSLERGGDKVSAQQEVRDPPRTLTPAPSSQSSGPASGVSK